MPAELVQYGIGAGGVLAGGRPHLDDDLVPLGSPVERLLGPASQGLKLFEDFAVHRIPIETYDLSPSRGNSSFSLAFITSSQVTSVLL